MRRDFSEEYKQKLIDMIQKNEQEKWSNFTDWIGDRFLDYADWMGYLNLYKYIASVDSYTRQILDKNNTTAAVINQIFREVYGEDGAYASRIRGTVSNAVCHYQNFLESMQKTVSLSGFNKEQIDVLIGMINDLNEDLKKIEYDAEFEECVYDLVFDKDGNKRKVGEIADADKDRVIEAFENVHPEWREELNMLLMSGEPNTLTEEDLRNIKYIAYTTEEPYRSIYLDNVRKYRIGSIGDPEILGAFYSPSKDSIYFADDDSGFEMDERGEYTTFFHESGHAMDYNIGTPFTEEFKYYSDKMEREVTLLEAIEYDVYNDIKDKIELKTSNEESIEKILDAFRYGNDTSDLSKKEKAIYEWVVAQYDSELDGEENEAACDVYGGITNLKIGRTTGYGHRPGNGESIEDFHYWYDESGNATGSQSKELWAEYFSYCMTGDEEALESLREHFPEASKILDGIAEEMAKSVK